MFNEGERKISFPVMSVEQPIGKFFVGTMSASDLVNISWFDIRKLNSDDFDEYLGIQRNVSPKRVVEIAKYVRLTDATFPTAVILAVEGRCASIEPLAESGDCAAFSRLTLSNVPGELDDENTVLFRGIARVLDGQHRIKGLKESGIDLESFQVNVCVFVDADLADQASVFATVNLAQTKVNRSLVYDLLSYSEYRSPERTCHTVTVLLDQNEASPFYQKIKRLGVATEGRFDEVLTQATIVKELLPYISKDILADRDTGRRERSFGPPGSYDETKLIFRHWFVGDQDEMIARQLMHYFEAVRRRWPNAWRADEKGKMLGRTNGFKGFMQFLRPAYNHLKKNDFVKMSDFLELFESFKIDEDEFIVKNFPAGGTGASKLRQRLMDEANFEGY